MKGRRLFFCATVALALGLSAAAAPRVWAQDPGHLAQLQIQVWPEYDRPNVLVMLVGTLADASNLPRDISVEIPTAATLNAVAYEDADGTPHDATSQSKDLGDGTTRVTFSVPEPQFRVEYYDNLLRGTPDKTLDYTFKAWAPADQVTLEVQQPLLASNFSVTPATQTTRNDGTFKYFTWQYSNVAVGQVLTVQAKYTKTDPNPSVLPATPATPTAASATAAPSTNWTSIFLVAALTVLGLTAVLGFLMLKQRSQTAVTAAAAPRAGRHRPRRAGGTVSQGAPVFCTQCGRALGPEDNFCPKCGTERRT